MPGENLPAASALDDSYGPAAGSTNFVSLMPNAPDQRLVDWTREHGDRRIAAIIRLLVLVPATVGLALLALWSNPFLILACVIAVCWGLRDIFRYRAFDVPGLAVGASILCPLAYGSRCLGLADGSFCGRLVRMRLASNLIIPGIVSGKENPLELVTLTAIMYIQHPFTVRAYRRAGTPLLSAPPPDGLQNIAVSTLPAGASLLFSGSTLQCDQRDRFLEWLRHDKDSLYLAGLLNDCCIESIEIQFGCLRVRTTVCSAAKNENMLAILETMTRVADSLDRFRRAPRLKVK